MPLNVVIELCKITKASKLFQRNFYLPLLEPLSPKDALRRHLIASEAQLQRMEHYIPVLEEYEKRQARRKLIVKGQVKKRQKRKASMKYVMPLLDMSMPGHAKLRNIFTRKSKGQGQCYTYRVPDKNCTLVITHQMERAIRDKDIIDVMVAHKNDKVVFVLKNNQKVSVPLVNYEDDAPFYRGDGWTNKEIESTHHYGKEAMALAHVFEGKEQRLEEWELDMMNMAALRKKKVKCEDTREFKALMTNQAKDIDWELFESQAKQIVEEQYTAVEDQPISMKVSSMEDTMNVNEKLQKSGKSVMELLPTVSDIPEIIKALKEDGEVAEVANVSGVKVKYMKKDYFVPGQMVRWEDSDLLVPGQTIFNENGDTEYLPGITVAIEGNPTLIPGLVMGTDPNKPIFMPGVSTITESGILKFEVTEDDLPQDLDQNSDDEEFEEKPLPSKQKVLESHIRPKRQMRELPDVVKDTETAVQALPLREEGNGDNEADDEVESENGDDVDDETESVASVIEVYHPPTNTASPISGEEMDASEQVVKDEGMLGYSTKIQTTEFLGAEKRALEEESPIMKEAGKTEVSHPPTDIATTSISGEETGACEQMVKDEGMLGYSTKILTNEFLGVEKRTLAEENQIVTNQLDVGEEEYKNKESVNKMERQDDKVNKELTEKNKFEDETDRKAETTMREAEKTEVSHSPTDTATRSISGEEEEMGASEQVVRKEGILGYSTKILTTEFLGAETRASTEENQIISNQLDVEEQYKNEELNKNMERKDFEVNKQLTDKEEFMDRDEKAETTESGAGKTEAGEVAAKLALTSMEPVLGQSQNDIQIRNKLEDGNPGPTNLTRNIDEVSDTPMEQPENFEENPVYKAADEELLKMMEQSTNVEEMKDQTVEVKSNEQSNQKLREDDQYVKDQLAQQQTQKEQESDTQVKGQSEEVTMEKASKEQEAKAQRENQAKLTVKETSAELVEKQQKDKKRFTRDQMTQKQTVQEKTLEEKLTKQVDKEERTNEHTIQSQSEVEQALGERATNKQKSEDSSSKMLAATIPMKNKVVQNRASEVAREEILNKGDSDTETVKVLIVDENLEKNQVVQLTIKNQLTEDGGMKLNAEKQKENVPEEQDAEEMSDELSSKEIKSWSTIVKEFFEVSMVVAGCYFINKLGKNLFNVSF
nr:unnamed protein product [Callosobruchus chinensis]